MAGTVKIVSGSLTETQMNLVVEYNSNDAYALVWQESLVLPRMEVKDIVVTTDLNEYVAKLIAPNAANIINARRKIVDLTSAFNAAVTAGTLYTVAGS